MKSYEEVKRKIQNMLNDAPAPVCWFIENKGIKHSIPHKELMNIILSSKEEVLRQVANAMRNIEEQDGDILDLIEFIAVAHVRKLDANVPDPNPPALNEKHYDEINIILVEPGKDPKEVTIKNTPETIHDLLQGWHKIVRSVWDDIAIVCNEEGAFQCLPSNRGFFGSFFFTSKTAPEFSPLTKEQVERILNWYAEDENEEDPFKYFDPDDFEE